MLILGIETSCDETSAALFDGKKLLGNVTVTQMVHEEFWGVIPELASREHLLKITTVVNKVFSKGGCSWSDVEGIAVTRGPGLIGSLLVGVSYAKAAAFSRSLPIVGVNHIEAHLWSYVFESSEITLPFIGLIVSGGHTQLWFVNDFGKYKLLGQTYDDAVGEAFDKIAKMLGLEYPGGPAIDRLSKSGNPDYYKFPRPALKDNSYNFSYSGLKTAVLYYLNKLSDQERIDHAADIAASFQKAAVETLIEKTIRASREYNIPAVVIGGGVAANSALKASITSAADTLGIMISIPSQQFCTDNAAMIAYVGYRKLQGMGSESYNFAADPSLKITES